MLTNLDYRFVDMRCLNFSQRQIVKEIPPTDEIP
jgi:hypothetical protein